MNKINCSVCGAEHFSMSHRSKYCSMRCKDKGRHNRRYVPSIGKPTLPDRVCKACGSMYTPKPGGYNSLYCSRRCQCKLAKPDADKSKRNRYYNEVIKLDTDRLSRHRRAGNRRRIEVREWLSNYKLERGCKDCGYNQFACALQLDHEGVKSIAIADARSSIKRLKEEIEKGKCVVRCANCHSVKTWRDKNRHKEQQSAT